MIHATVRRDRAGRILALTIAGHDPSAPAGANLACAAVSAMAEMARYALHEVARLPVRSHAAPGRVLIELPPAGTLSAAEETVAQTVLESLAGGLARIGGQGGPNSPRIVVRSETDGQEGQERDQRTGFEREAARPEEVRR